MKRLNYREDWHIHTKYSYDSWLKPEDLLKAAKEKGLKLIAVTDHGTIKGGIRTKEIATKKGINIEVIVGAEIKTEEGEISGLFLKEEIRSRKLKEVIAEIHSQGGKVLIAHPYGSIRTSSRKYKIEEIAPLADYIEVYNGRSLFQFFFRHRIKKLIKAYNLKAVRGSDAHFGFEVGNIANWFNLYGILGFFLSGLLKVLFFFKGKKAIHFNF